LFEAWTSARIEVSDPERSQVRESISEGSHEIGAEEGVVEGEGEGVNLGSGCFDVHCLEGRWRLIVGIDRPRDATESFQAGDESDEVQRIVHSFESELEIRLHRC